MSAADRALPLLMQGIPFGEISKLMQVKLRTVKGYAASLYEREGIMRQDCVPHVKLIANHASEIEPGEPCAVSLTQRESQIVALVARGLRYRDVATLLGTTQHVIKNDLKSIFDKIGVDNGAELAIWHYSHVSQMTLRSGR